MRLPVDLLYCQDLDVETQRLAGQWEKALDTMERAGKLEISGGRAAGPGAVGRAIGRTGQARKREENRKRRKPTGAK